MKISLLGVGNQPLISTRIRSLSEDAGLINWSAVARLLGIKRSTFLSRVATHGLENTILFYVTQQKMKNVN